eukprot:98150-Amphidinium_carterae.1
MPEYLSPSPSIVCMLLVVSHKVCAVTCHFCELWAKHFAWFRLFSDLFTAMTSVHSTLSHLSLSTVVMGRAEHAHAALSARRVGKKESIHYRTQFSLRWGLEI